MTCYLVIYEVLPIPASSTIFVEEITKSIEFESLNPISIIRLFDKDFKLDRLINGKDKYEIIIDADQTATFFRDTNLIYVFSIAFFALIIILRFSSFFMTEELAEKIVKAVGNAVSNFFFTGFINSLLICFIKMTISVKV